MNQADKKPMHGLSVNWLFLTVNRSVLKLLRLSLKLMRHSNARNLGKTMIILFILGAILLILGYAVPMAYPLNLILRVGGAVCLVVAFILLAFSLTDFGIRSEHVGMGP